MDTDWNEMLNCSFVSSLSFDKKINLPFKKKNYDGKFIINEIQMREPSLSHLCLGICMSET